MNLNKYPRTPHLTWSPGTTDDDIRLTDINHFIGRNVVVTEKMDGECTSMYRNHIHARSLDSRNHPSRHWVKNFWNGIRYYIPEDIRICGENLYARHSIAYDSLPSYFLGFSVWGEENFCMSWTNTLEWFKILNINPVPILYEGKFEESTIKKLYQPNMEGYVVRTSGAFHYDDFGMNIAKYVRKDHVQTGTHWMNSEIIPNQLTKQK